MESLKGKFIVIDGTDGSGKTTQFNLLKNRLEQEGYDVAVADFPQYNTKSAGMVEEYLSGKYGTANEVSPYQASIFYAIDRFDASRQIREWLKEGKVVLANRYVSASMGHQGSKIEDPLERKIFFNWLYDLEYRLFNIPRPDLYLILFVEAEIAQQLAKGRQREDWVGKTKDIHEDDLEHLRQASETYRQISQNFADFRLIKCTNNQEILKPEEIHYLIWLYTSRILNTGEKIEHRKNFSAISDIISRDPKMSAHLEKNPTNQKTDEPLQIAVQEALSEAPKAVETKTAKTLTLRVQKIKAEATLPTKEQRRKAGFDLYACDYYSIPPYQQALVSTGLKIKIPAGHVGLIWDKSGLANFGFKIMGGVIDANYREEVRVVFKNLSEDIYHIIPGQKIATLLIQPIIDPQLIEEQE